MDIYDIAELSGYSTATVSRVINKSKNVIDKARRIIEIIVKVFIGNVSMIYNF